MPELDLSFVDETVERLGRGPQTLIPILQAIQDHYRYVPREALQRVCEISQITPAAIAGVATFYTQFRHRPVGRHIIHVCHGTACHVKGAGLVQQALERQLRIADGQDTDEKGLFTIEKIACLGCCTLAPVIQIDGVTYGRLTPHMVAEVLEDFLRQEESGVAGVERSEPPGMMRLGAARPTLRVGARRPPATPAAQPGVRDGLAIPATELGEIRIGLGSCCVAQGSGKVHEAIRRTLSETGAPAVVKRVGCVGMCHQTPLVELVPPRGPARLFAKVGAEEAPAILLKHFKPPGIARRIGYRLSRWLDRLLTDEIGDPVARHSLDVRDGPVCAFLGRQRRLATEYCGQIDPTDLDEYLRHGGFESLRRCTQQLSPEQIIEEVQSSGLRGRGGAGFPTGIKWAKVRAAQGDQKYIICNGDEGDPGAFMDRMLLESFPYRIIEGMAIAARAVGATEGIFYIRAEYPLAVQRVGEAIRLCEERGLLGERRVAGERVAGVEQSSPPAPAVPEGELPLDPGHPRAARVAGVSRSEPPVPVPGGELALDPGHPRPYDPNLGPLNDFCLHLSIQKGAGAFVCGEETALLASIEGRRGMPRLRPPYPAERGLWGRPTLVGNVETYALVPWIIRHGAAAFAALGTAKSKGTKVFALAGKVRRGGLIEVPMGVTIRQIVEEIGGGVAGDRQFKAVQVGGPSGGCVPAELADTPVDYEALVGVGAIMGSGGLVVLDDRDCMVDIARYFLRFTQDQSCGKCTFCRIGTRRMLDILDRICTGEGRQGDLEQLQQLAVTVQAGSLCALGGTAPNPVLSTLRYFREEYEAHLQGRCPAGRCTALIHYRVTDDCIGCTLCAQQCPVGAIPFTPYRKHAIDQEKCTRCDTCRQVCPTGAVVVE